MKLFAAFLRLIRWQNLFFIALTQWLFYHFIVIGKYPPPPQAYFQNDTLFLFGLLIFSSVLIAAAGNIINDYFDMNIDAVNKPTKNLIDRIIKRRWAMVWHLLFSFVGILLSCYISYKTGKWVIAIANAFTVLLLWFYSTTFKKKLLAGNIIIAALTAWVIVVVYFFAGATILSYKGWDPQVYPFNIKRLFKLTIFYASFAFIVSLIREAVKDMEDMYGDAQFGCETMPIKWGIPATKVFVAVWMVVCIASLFIVQVYSWQSGGCEVALYSFVFVLIPIALVLKDLYKAKIVSDYARLSKKIKYIMLAGILSMVFFKFLS